MHELVGLKVGECFQIGASIGLIGFAITFWFLSAWLIFLGLLWAVLEALRVSGNRAWRS